MHSNPIPSPAEIRKIAVEIVHDHPAGIRLSDLYRKTSDALRDARINEHSVKNALWDLDQKFPNEVYKKKNSERRVTLFPTLDRYLNLPTVQEDSAPYKAGRDITLDIGVLKILDVVRHIEISDFDVAINLEEEDKDILSIEQIQAISQFKSAIDQIKRVGEVLQNVRLSNRL